MRDVRKGEFWSINDINTRGHKSLITGKNKKGQIQHLPITHAPVTRRQNNIKLNENPQKGDESISYILPRIQIAQFKFVGKKQNNMQIKNAIDKSVIRHKKSKKKKK